MHRLLIEDLEKFETTYIKQKREHIRRISKCVVYSNFVDSRFPRLSGFLMIAMCMCFGGSTMFKVLVISVSFFILRIGLVCFMLCSVFCEFLVCSECCVLWQTVFLVY